MSGDEVTRIPAGLPGGGPRQAMSLPHNIRPDQMVGPDTSGTRWKRFQPLKKLQRMFRRKSKTKDDGEFPDPKSFSAGQLPPADLRRPSRRDSQPLQSRLSVSHDSIFQSESGGGGAQAGAQMGSALSIPSVPGASGQLAAELRGVLLKRRADDSDEDDPGLPHSPSSPSTPPATSRHHQTELKGQSGKSGGSCSDGSLLSMYSSGTCTDDDIFGPLSKHPSRASLGRDADGLELETGAALSHSAAKHRIAVRPRRTHGAPRPRRARARPSTAGPAATGLPPTVEEESPPATPTTRTAARARAEGSSPARRLSPERPRRAPSVSPSRSQSTRIGSPEPAVAAASPVSIRPTQVKRSKSSVADGRIRDVSPRKFWARDTPSPAAATASAAATPATDEDRRADRGETFFSRIFGSRRSGRKKKEDRSLSPETAAPEESQQPTPTPAPMSAPVVAPSRRPPMPRHRDRSQFGSSPASAMHADIIRLPPSESNRAAELVEPPRRATEMPRGADVLRSVDLLRAAEPGARPASEVPRPPADALRRGPAFLADVRAEVAALAAGGDRGDRGDVESSAVSPQVLRRQRAAAAAASNVRPTDSPRARPRLVGLTAYQQRVAHMQRSPSPEPVTGPAARRSFSCENVGEPETGRGSGMALDRVLGFIKSTSAAQAAAAERQPVRQEQRDDEQETAMPVPSRPAGSPGAGPKSLDSSLLSAAAEPPPAPPPNKASSAESVQSGGQERMTRSAGDQQVPEFLRVQLNRVESHNRDSAAAGESRNDSRPAERRDSGRDSGRDSAERRSSGRDSTEPEFAASSNASDESPPQLRRPSAARSGSPPDLRRRPSQARSRGSASSGDAEPVVLRNKPTPSSEDSELLKVFKRRSLKSRDPEDLASAVVVTSEQDRPNAGAQRTSRPGAGDEKENEQPREQSEETVVSVCVSVPASRPVTIAAPPAAEEASETPRRGAAVTRRESEAVRRPSGQEEEAGRPAGWLKQAVRERRERREQLEQKQLRTPATTTKELIIESEPGRAAGASRSSRVLEMANTFQKLQTT